MADTARSEMADTAKQREKRVRERKARRKQKAEELKDNPVEPVPVVGALEGIADVPEEANPVEKSAAAEAPQEGRVELEEEASEAGNLEAAEANRAEVVPSGQVSQKKEAISMGLMQERDVGKLLRNRDLMDQVVTGLTENSQSMDTLVEDIANKIKVAMENDSDLRQRLIKAAIANEAFRKKLVRKLIDELS